MTESRFTRLKEHEECDTPALLGSSVLLLLGLPIMYHQMCSSLYILRSITSLFSNSNEFIWANGDYSSTVLAAIASSLICVRMLFIIEKYSSILRCRLLATMLVFLSFLPLAGTLQSCTSSASLGLLGAWNRITPLLSGTNASSHGFNIVSETSVVAFILGAAVIIAILLKGLLCPRLYARHTPDGLLIGAGIWRQLIGNKKVAWADIESVAVSSGGRQKELKLRLKDTFCANFNFKWEDFERYVNPPELMNDIKTYAPDAMDSSCLVKTPDNHEYTELWLKYFSSSASRNRSGGLQAGELLHEGRYEIAGELGQGGQGTAYLASEQGSSEDAGTTIVLKEYILPVHRGEAILQQSMQKLHREAEILSKIHHPSIVELKDTFVEDHRGYLVMEYVEGNVLKQMVQSQGPQPEQLVIDIGLQVCDALDYLHNMDPPVIHRDITPDNLILQPDGRVKLVDFNVAQQLEPSATSTVVGKHAYIPPEQFRGKPTRQSDIFALGGTLYFLLAAKEPEPLSVSHPALDVPTVSQALDAIVAKATALDQNLRFSDANEFRQALLLIQTKVEQPAMDKELA